MPKLGCCLGMRLKKGRKESGMVRIGSELEKEVVERTSKDSVRSKNCLLNNQKSKQVLKCCRLSRTTGLQLMCSTTKNVDVLILNQQKSSKSCSTTKKTFPSSSLTVLLAPRLGFEDPAAALQNSQTLLPGLLLVRFSTADMTTHGRSTIIYAEKSF